MAPPVSTCVTDPLMGPAKSGNLLSSVPLVGSGPVLLLSILLSSLVQYYIVHNPQSNMALFIYSTVNVKHRATDAQTNATIIQSPATNLTLPMNVTLDINATIVENVNEIPVAFEHFVPAGPGCYLLTEANKNVVELLIPHDHVHSIRVQQDYTVTKYSTHTKQLNTDTFDSPLSHCRLYSVLDYRWGRPHVDSNYKQVTVVYSSLRHNTHVILDDTQSIMLVGE